MPQQRLVIIGNGMAGARTAEEILRRNPHQFHITILGLEPTGNYNRILLSNVLNRSAKPDEILLNPLDWYSQNNINLIAGVPVIGINTKRKHVMLVDARTVPYDRLVIATGSRPFVPKIPGIDLAGVFTFRSLDDCNQIAHYTRKARTVAVIGGGLLGLEAANGLLTHGLNVHVVDISPHLMSVQLDPAGGAILERTIRSLGVTVHTSKSTVEILATPDSRPRALRFADNSQLPCDMVVISAGIRPNIDCAENASLDFNRGILVNDQLQTSNPDIYAVGECIEHAGATYGLVAPIYDQCNVLADVLTNTNPNAKYTGSITATKLKVMGVHVAALGQRDPAPGDEIVRYEEPDRGIYKKIIVRNNKLAGAILLGDLAPYPTLLDLLQTHRELPASRTSLLFPPEAPAAISLADLPDDKQICDCNGVSKAAIVAAIKSGKTSLPAVGKCTRAGTGCGSCKTMIKSLIEAVAGEVKADPSESWYVPAIPLDKPALVAEIKKRQLKSVSAVLAALATKDDEKSKMGLANLLKSLWNEDYIDERDARFINDRVHANIQKDSTFSVIPRIYGGVTTADDLIRIGSVAKKYHVPMVKITGGQRIDLLGISRENLPRVWADLGMPSGYAYTKAFRTCKTCVGSEFCRFGTNDSTALGIAIEKRFQGIETPAKLKLAVSGCPRNCAEATVKDIGIVATEGGEWEIVLGGAAGASVRKADVFCRAKSQSEALTIIGRFIEYYRQNARWLERTYDFVPRIGIPKLREILLNDSEGIAADLDAAIQASIDAYSDPWSTDTQSPAYPGQFDPERTLSLPVL
jgi:nitrite reductase (NADH) large subunit